MGLLRRNRGTPSGRLVVFLFVITVVFVFDSCRLHRRFTFPKCCQHDNDFLQPASQFRTMFAGNKLTSSSLASQQSYGFFNDIVDESWRLMQRRARTSLHVKGQASKHEHPNSVSSYLNNLQVSVLVVYSNLNCITK